METVTISSNYQIVIPANVRRSLELYPGQKIQMIVYRNRIELIPVKPIQTTFSLLPGIDTTVERA